MKVNRGDILTKQEIRFVAVVVGGAVMPHEIAAAKGIRRSTVGTYLTRIYKKTGARNLAELILMALDRVPSDCPSLPLIS